MELPVPPSPRQSGSRLRESLHTDYRIERAVRLLSENSSCTLADLANGCSLSVSRLSYLFKAGVGITLGTFLRSHRFAMAMVLLATTDMQIKQIAYALGYHHTSSFVRAFELRTGLSPGEYRFREGRRGAP